MNKIHDSAIEAGITGLTTLHEATVQLTPAAPFDFARSLAFLGGFRPMDGEQSLTEDALVKAIAVAGETVLFELRSTGSVEEPGLSCTLRAARPIGGELKERAVDRIALFLSLYDDLRPFYELGLGDPVMAAVIRQLYGLHQVKFPTPFEAACWLVLSHRISMAAAASIKQNLARRFGTSLEHGGQRYLAFPEAGRLASVPEGEMRDLLRNEQKADYLGHVIRAFAGVDEAFLRTAPYAEVRRWLLSIKGVGEWTADGVLLRGLGRMEALHFAPETVAGRKMTAAIARAYTPGRDLTGQEALELAGRYGPWQGYWSYYLRTAA